MGVTPHIPKIITTTMFAFEKKEAQKGTKREIESALHSRQIPRVHNSKSSEHASLYTPSYTATSMLSSVSFSNLREVLPTSASFVVYSSPKGSRSTVEARLPALTQQQKSQGEGLRRPGGSVGSERKRPAFSSIRYAKKKGPTGSPVSRSSQAAAAYASDAKAGCASLAPSASSNPLRQ